MYALVNFDGQIGVVVDVAPEEYEIMSSSVQLAGRLDSECGGGIGHAPRCKHIISVLASETVRPNAVALTVTIMNTIFLRCSDDWETIAASPAYMAHAMVTSPGLDLRPL